HVPSRVLPEVGLQLMLDELWDPVEPIQTPSEQRFQAVRLRGRQDAAPVERTGHERAHTLGAAVVHTRLGAFTEEGGLVAHVAEVGRVGTCRPPRAEGHVAPDAISPITRSIASRTLVILSNPGSNPISTTGT